MKSLSLFTIVILTFISPTTASQEDCDENYNEVINSAEKSKYKEIVLRTFDTKFSEGENNVILLEAQNKGFRMTFFPVDSKLIHRVDQWMSETACKDCPLYLETKTNDPIKMIYDSIKCKDVYQISRIEDELVLKLFREN